MSQFPDVTHPNTSLNEGLQGNFEDMFYNYDDPLTIVLLCFYVPIFLIAFLGNILVLLIVLPHMAFWGVTSHFLVNLAVADLLVAVVCIPLTVANRVYLLWAYGEVLCRATGYLQGVSVAASCFLLASMSLDRCLAIRHPMKFRSFRTQKHVRILIILIWIISAGIMSPLAAFTMTTTHESLDGSYLVFCGEQWPSGESRRIFDIAQLIILYVIPGTVTVVSYTMMGRRLWVRDKSLGELQRSESGQFRHNSLENQMAGRRNIAKMLIVMASLFALCWLPYYCMVIYQDFDTNGLPHTENVVAFAVLLGQANSATNPVLYCFMNKTFGRMVKRRVAGGCSSGSGQMVFLSRMMSATKGFRTSIMHNMSSKKNRSSSSKRTTNTELSSPGKMMSSPGKVIPEQNGAMMTSHVILKHNHVESHAGPDNHVKFCDPVRHPMLHSVIMEHSEESSGVPL